MSRANKRSRLKALPPRIQLTERDAATGSFPVRSRIPSDNRTGRYSSPWNDRNVIDVGSYPSSANTWKDNIVFYLKFNDDQIVKDGFYGNSWKRFQEDPKYGSFFISASYVGDWWLNQTASPTIATLWQCVAFDSAPFYSGSRTSPFVTASGGGFTDLELGFNAFGRNDKLLYFPQHVSTTPGPFDTRPFYRVLFASDPDPSFAYTPLSIATWVWINRVSDSQNTIIRKENSSELDLSINTDGNIQFLVYTNSSNYINVQSTGELFLNSNRLKTWNHIVVTYASSSQDVNDFTFYLNGEEVPISAGGVGTFTGMTTSGGEQLFIGNGDFGNLLDYGLDGTLADLAVFNKVLSADEVRKIYECRSSLLLDEQGGVVYPVGLPTQNRWIDNTEFTSSMIVPNARTVLGVGDGFVHFSPGQELTAFKDYDLPAVDGKSQNLAFYATGSTVIDAGEGFQQPLWDKSVIEFEYTVLTTSSVGYRSASNGNSEGNDYAMMYWNPKLQRFQGVGSPNSWDHYQSLYDDFLPFTNEVEASSLAATTYLAEKACGFMPFVPNVANSQQTSYFSQVPITDFGFPFDDKYHVPFENSPSSSMLISLRDKIDKPFIAEKIVVEFSCSHFSRDYWGQSGGGAHGEAINTFFILNQRKMKGFFSGSYSPSIDYIQDSPGKSVVPVTFASSTSSLDLVTFNQFAFLSAATSSFTSSTDVAWRAVREALDDRNIQYYLCGLSNGTGEQNAWERSRFDFTGSISLSGTVNLAYPTQNEERSLSFGVLDTEIPFTFPGPRVQSPLGAGNTLQYPGYLGGRSGVSQLGISDSRNLLRNTVGVERIDTEDKILDAPARFLKIQQATPYILQPTDNLIFGFNCAYLQASQYTDAFPFTSSSVNRGPTLSILPGKFIVRIYGSQVADGEESHDTLNQLLSSNTIHEVIE